MHYKIPEDAIITAVYENDGEMTGLVIETDKGNIKLLIDDYQCCCEKYGALFLETLDDTSKYVGARILDVSDTNSSVAHPDDYERETQLNIVTTKGVLQYAMYNDHNGYYSHCTFTQVFDTIEKGSL